MDGLKSGVFKEEDEPVFYHGALAALESAIVGKEEQKHQLVVFNRVRLLIDEIRRYRHQRISEALGAECCARCAMPFTFTLPGMVEAFSLVMNRLNDPNAAYYCLICRAYELAQKAAEKGDDGS